MYGPSNSWPLHVKDQGQNSKTLKPNISKTVQDRKSKEVRSEVMYGLSNGRNILTSDDS